MPYEDVSRFNSHMACN